MYVMKNSISNITKRSWKVAFLIWLKLGTETNIFINRHTTKPNVEQKQILWKPRCYELHNPFQNCISVLIVKIMYLLFTWIVSGQHIGFLFPYYIIDQKHVRNIFPSLNNNMNWNRITLIRWYLNQGTLYFLGWI